jgi:hypothetical protein
MKHVLQVFYQMTATVAFSERITMAPPGFTMTEEVSNADTGNQEIIPVRSHSAAGHVIFQ